MRRREQPEPLPSFLTEQAVSDLAKDIETPFFIYDRTTLVEAAQEAKSFESPNGLVVRYAMKANPNAAILRTFKEQGLSIDASSGEEAQKAIEIGFSPADISLTSQLVPKDLVRLVRRGVKYNASSLYQLENFGKNFPLGNVGIRVNSGLGSGGNHKTNVGGPASSFGIWHEDLPDAQRIVNRYGLTVETFHSHIGSGSDPKVWKKVASMCIDLMHEHSGLFGEVKNLNLGGGYKVGRMSYETSTDLREISAPIADEIASYSEERGEPLNLEIEPGTFLVANAGAIISKIRDIKSTGSKGYMHYICDSGMTENLRPSLYAAQHPLTIINEKLNDDDLTPAVVHGRACESGDLMTPDPDDPSKLRPRLMKTAHIGSLLVIGGAGAYCESMNASGYNSYPKAIDAGYHLGKLDW